MEFETRISEYVWSERYRLAGEKGISDTWMRVARFVAQAESSNRSKWESEFFNLLHGFKFLPAGRILAGAGSSHDVTLFNCFVIGALEDSIDGIFRRLHESAVTMQHGGGIGVDFSPLRPRNRLAVKTGRIASGPVSFMQIWNEMCQTILSTGSRRGAMMATLRCDHPDIEEFVTAKRNHPGSLNNFNLSVLVSDAFMQAIYEDRTWDLLDHRHKILKSVPARELWHLIMESTYQASEPGVLYVDRINRENNLNYRETISCTNPCGEVPLPPFGSCNIGSINLTAFINDPFTQQSRLDRKGILETARLAVRFLDDVIDVAHFPYSEQGQYERHCRRIGVGITGLADCLAMLGMQYGDSHTVEFVEQLMKDICETTYETSIRLSDVKGSFEALDLDAYLKSPFIQRSLPENLQSDIKRFGIRNSHLLSVAPAGTISLLANNVSSGIEPIYDVSYERTVRLRDGGVKTFAATDYAFSLWRKQAHRQSAPQQFIDAKSLTPEQHLEMQAVVQKYVDNAVSKTINVARDLPFEKFIRIYESGYEKGVKGCTTFRPNHFHEGILRSYANEKSSFCCAVEREAD